MLFITQSAVDISILTASLTCLTRQLPKTFVCFIENSAVLPSCSTRQCFQRGFSSSFSLRPSSCCLPSSFPQFLHLRDERDEERREGRRGTRGQKTKDEVRSNLEQASTNCKDSMNRSPKAQKPYLTAVTDWLNNDIYIYRVQPSAQAYFLASKRASIILHCYIPKNLFFSHTSQCKRLGF